MKRVAIKGYEGAYEIDNKGNVFSLDREVTGGDGTVYPRKGRLLKQSLNSQTGYPVVSLWKNNKGTNLCVHRLLAEAFIPNPLNKPEVNHIDGNKTNCCISNLEWVTPSENRQHAYDTGLRVPTRKLSTEQLDLFLDAFLDGMTLTDIANQAGCSLPRLSINIRTRAEETGLLEWYERELAFQKTLRNRAANESKKKRVAQYTPGGLFITEYESMGAAAKALGKNSTGSISNALNPSHPQKLAYGFLWKFA